MWSESPKLKSPFNTNSATQTKDLRAQFAGALATSVDAPDNCFAGTSATSTAPIEYIDSDSESDVANPADLLKRPRPVKAVETGDSDDVDVCGLNLNHINIKLTFTYGS
jgi:hypothetical protein